MSSNNWSNERLLEMALTMLDVCREEQEKMKKSSRRWLIRNTTLETIRERVAEIKAAK